MNVFAIINKLKEGFFKEEALRPYTRPPFNAKEWESTVPNDSPSLMEGRKNVLLPAAPPVKNDFEENALLRNNLNQENPQQEAAYPQQYSGEIPVAFPDGFGGGVKKRPQSVEGYYELYVLLFNYIASQFSSESLMTPYLVKEELFEPFYSEQEEKIQQVINVNGDVTSDCEMAKKALFQIRSKFDEVFSSYEETEGKEDFVGQNDIEKFEKDFTEQEIIALFNNNKKNKSKMGYGAGLSNVVIQDMKRSPEFANNSKNQALLDSLEPYLKNLAVRSSLTDADRKELYKSFMYGYLQLGNPKEITARWNALFPQEDENGLDVNDSLDNDSLDDDNMEQYENPDEMEFERRERLKNKPKTKIRPKNQFGIQTNKPKKSREIDEADFLQNELFMADTLNKDLFISFFLEKDMIDFTVDLIRENLDEGEEMTLRQDAGKYTADAMNILQNDSNINILKDALIHIMTDLKSPYRNKFFNWVQNEIRRKRERAKTYSGGRNSVQQGDTLSPEGDPIGDNIDQKKHTGFPTSFRLPIPKDVLRENGLKKDGPVINRGDTIDYATLSSLRENWNKISGFITDVIEKMKQGYPQADKETKLAILQKVILWKRAQKASEDSIKFIIESVNREGKNLTDPRTINLLNQDWRDLFKQEFWKEFNWDTENAPDIKQVVDMAVADGLARTPEEAFSTIFGKVDFKQNVGVFRKDDPNTARDQTSNVLTQKSQNFNALKNFLLDPSLVEKYGSDTLVSFVDFIGFDSSSLSIGALLSNNNSGSLEDKLNYLSRLSQRGTISKSTIELENMSPKEIIDIFNNVKDILKLIYSPVNSLKKEFQDENSTIITDDLVSRFAQLAGLGHIRSKRDFSKAKKDEKDSIIKAFYDTEFGKYSVDQIGQVEAMRAFVDRHVQYDVNNHQFLENHGYPSGNDFLSAIGITDQSLISDQIQKMPSRRVFQIAKHFYPKLYEAYNKKLLSKTKAKDKRTIYEVVDNIINDNAKMENLKEDKKDITPWGQKSPLNDALLYAEIFDFKRELFASAYSKFRMLRKIAMQKQLNQIAVLRQKFSNLNADTTVLDNLVSRIKNGRR